MKILDLCCGAGGATRGYQLAFPGAHITGVDINPQQRYVGDLFIQADALTFDLAGFDLIHGSPPCQERTTMSNRYRGQGGVADSHPQLIPAMREMMLAAGTPYVIENVPGARKLMRSPVTLSGGAFGLKVERPRLFECSFAVTAPPFVKVAEPVGVYGARHDGRRLFTRKDGTEQRCARTLQEGRDAMGISWMEWRELAESIPPAYTEHIGRAFLKAL